ncbi:Protein phosphatase 1 regulatory subunit 11 [Strongyloides ratti]|uniref:E3 ubiquitin-protein ligase PPP1R11 n=1 Tax=Strongyloides ratti TaxID=34506 RepID=A0A090MWP6_STRRB|nr:Protein phosphatase 1 regulatory subunit 11 [Strongyloides ratti]CEF64049.1 Protein phosphatase 1 regulatory subunit 11 [Strongyloides ratti]
MEENYSSTSTNTFRSHTTTVTELEQNQEPLILRLKPVPKEKEEELHVTWDANVVNNEHLGRRKSNCCCIYVPPREWDKPETRKRNEYETEFCRGHTEINLFNVNENKEEQCA